jgi:uncharacterized protein (TIRG00374 family)
MPPFEPPANEDDHQGKTPRRVGPASLAIRAVLTLLIVGAIAYFVDWARLLETLRNVHFPTLLLAYGLYVFDRILMAYKWGLLLRVQAIRIPLWVNTSIYSAATLIGTILPSTVGADAMRVLWLSRRKYDTAGVASSIFVERLGGFAVSSVLAGLGVSYLMFQRALSGPLSRALGVAVVLSVVLLLGLLLMSFSGVLSKKLGRLVKAYAPSKAFIVLQRLNEANAAYRHAGGVVSVFVTLTFVEQILTFGMNYVLARALGIEVEPMVFLAALAVTFLIIRVPITIDAIGVFEGTLFVLLLSAGLQTADVVALGLVGRILNITSFLPGAIVAFMTAGIRTGDLRGRKTLSEGRELLE